MPKNFFHLSLQILIFVHDGSLNDSFPSLSSEHSIKYHSDASVTIPTTLSTSCPLSISSALRLRDKVDSICTDAWANPFIKSSFLTSIIPRTLLFYYIVEISLPIS